jgi:hypothetical protein
MEPDNETPTETYEPTLRDHVEAFLGVLTLGFLFYVLLILTPN